MSFTQDILQFHAQFIQKYNCAMFTNADPCYIFK